MSEVALLDALPGRHGTTLARLLARERARERGFPRRPDDGAALATVVDDLDAIAERVAAAGRNLRLGPMSQALARHTASEIAACAAELSANIAILESVDV